MAKEDIKAVGCTIIDGIVLTEKGTRVLKGMQDDDNAYLKEVRERFSNIISILINRLDELDSQSNEETLNGIKYLNNFSQDLKGLMKP